MITTTHYKETKEEKERRELKKDLGEVFATNAKPTPVRLFVRPEAKRKMDAYVKLVQVEVGWMGFIKQFERKHEESGLILPSLLVLDDVFLFQQEVSSGSVDSGIDEGIDHLTEVLEKVTEMGRSTEELRFFAHSHANFDAYHSPTDTSQIDEWGMTGLDWFISHVQNKKGKIDCRLDVFRPFRIQVAVEEMLISDVKIDQDVVREIEENVTLRQTKTTGNWYNTNNRNKNSKEGTVVSDEAKDPKHVIDDKDKAGTMEKPVITYKSKSVDGVTHQVRQEWVFGTIIHEAIVGSPASKARIDMSIAERWAYYREYMSRNPSLTDPTKEQLDEHKSRSIQRSEQKREETESTTSQSPGKSPEQEDKGQIQIQSEAKRSSGEKKNVKKNESSQKKDDQTDPKAKDEKKESHLLTKEEQQESLIVIEGEKEQVVAEEEDKSKEKTAEEQVVEEFEKFGFAV